MNMARTYSNRARIALGTTVLLAAMLVAPPATIPADPDLPEGVSQERLQRIHEMVERTISARDYSGAVTLVARNGHIVHFEAQGLMDVEGHKPMMKDSVFRLASMSKVVTAVAVLIIVEEGKVRLTDPVSRFIPEFKDMKVAVPDPDQRPERRRQSTRSFQPPAPSRCETCSPTPPVWAAARSAWPRWRKSRRNRTRIWRRWWPA